MRCVDVANTRVQIAFVVKRACSLRFSTTTSMRTEWKCLLFPFFARCCFFLFHLFVSMACRFMFFFSHCAVPQLCRSFYSCSRSACVFCATLFIFRTPMFLLCLANLFSFYVSHFHAFTRISFILFFLLLFSFSLLIHHSHLISCVFSTPSSSSC